MDGTVIVSFRGSSFKSLNVHVPWTELSVVLGLTSEGRTFPLETRCPFCEGSRLTIYQDSTTRGEWHYCFDCGHSGDMVELAAAVWECSISDAVIRLSHEGLAIPTERMVPEVIEAYVQHSLSARARTLKLWRRSQQHLIQRKSTTINNIRRRLGLTDDMSRERQLKGPAMMFGSATREEIIKALYPDRIAADNSSFLNKSWGDILVVPYFATPNHITSFLFVGKDGRKGERLFRYVPPQTQLTNREIGLAGLQVAIEHTAGYVVAMEDPLMMLRIQMRHLSSSLVPLPLVSWKADDRGRTFDAWSALNGKKLIFWTMQPTAELILQCYRTDACLTIMGPNVIDRKEVSVYIRRYTPTDLLRMVQAKSQPWLEAIASWMRRASEGSVAKVLNRIGILYPPLLPILRAHLGSSIPLQHELLLRRVRLNETTEVLERGDSWYIIRRGQERRILNATIRVEQIVSRRSDCKLYHGYITQRRSQTPFSVEITGSYNTQSAIVLAILDEGRTKRLQLHMENRDAALVWKSSLAFHEPERTKTRAVGWDANQSLFRFRHMEISLGGQVLEHNSKTMSPTCPGPDLRHDFRLSEPLTKKLVLPYVETEVVWGIAISLLASIIAQATNRDVPTTILSGMGLQTPHTSILSRLGVSSQCISRSTVPPHAANEPEWPHNWPLCVKVGNNVNIGSLVRWLLETGNRNTISLQDQAAARVLLLHGGFQVLEFGGVLKPRMLSLIPMEYLIPSYLRYTTKRQFEFEERETWWETVQHDIATWLEAEGHDVTPIQQARNHMLLDNDPEIVPKAVAALYRRGVFRLEAPSRYTLRVLKARLTSEGLVVTTAQFEQACKIINVQAPDTSAWPKEIQVPRRLIEQTLTCHPSACCSDQ